MLEGEMALEMIHKRTEWITNENVIINHFPREQCFELFKKITMNSIYNTVVPLN